MAEQRHYQSVPTAHLHAIAGAFLLAAQADGSSAAVTDHGSDIVGQVNFELARRDEERARSRFGTIFDWATDNGPMSFDEIVTQIRLSPDETSEVVIELRDRGWLAALRDHDEYFPTKQGYRVAAARFAKEDG
jgi:hypothetical protein